MKKLLGTTALALTLAVGGVYADKLATVNGTQITTDEAESYVAQTQPGAKYANLPADQKKMVVDRLIERELFIEQAKKEGLDKDGEFQKQLNLAKDELMVRLWITKQFENTVISDSEAKKYYDEHATEFVVPAQVHARHILVENEKDAKDIIGQLKGLKGDDLKTKFIELAKAKSTGPTGPKGGDLGFFASGQMVKPFNDAVFGMKVGTASATPVKTQFGYHVIYLQEKKPSKTISYDDAKNRIVSLLKQKAFNAKMAKMADALKKGAKIVKEGESNATKK